MKILTPFEIQRKLEIVEKNPFIYERDYKEWLLLLFYEVLHEIAERSSPDPKTLAKSALKALDRRYWEEKGS